MKTIDINNGTEREHYLHIEEREDGFWYCTSGTTADGLYFESNDIGPFATEQEALDILSEIHTTMTVKYNGTEYDNERAIRDAVADGKIHSSDAAHMIVEIRTGMTNASHPDYQQEWSRVHAALAADKV